MYNFTAYNPTRIHFGRGVTTNLGIIASSYGNRALLITGKGSVKENGIYDKIFDNLDSAGIKIIEYSGIPTNPSTSDVDKAAELGREKSADMIIGLGGGSVIDAAKLTSIAIANKVSNSWYLMNGSTKPTSKLPLIAVLTVAATGTESNHIAVLQNREEGRKFGFKTELNFPEHAFLDPSFTCSVPRLQTAYGIIDLISHVLENYFGDGEASLSDRYSYAIINEAIEYGPRLLNNLENYDLRARIMWSATNALNGLTTYGRKSGCWFSHAIGHTISVLYDLPHAATLSIILPSWMQHLSILIPERIAELGRNTLGCKDAVETVNAYTHLFKSLGAPVCLRDVNMGEIEANEILNLLIKNQAQSRCFPTDDELRKSTIFNAI